MDKLLSIPISAILLMALCTLKVGATDLTVCASGCDFTSIQAAINASDDEDIILIGKGVYRENLNTGQRDITLQGAGADKTIIDGGGVDRVITEADFLTVSDVTLTRGKTDACGGAIDHTSLESYTIRNSIIKDNHAKVGGAMCVEDQSLKVINSVVTNNKATLDGGAIAATFEGATIALQNSIIIDNKAGRNGGGIACVDFATDVRMTNSMVANNTAYHDGGGIYSGIGGSSYIENSSVTNNTAHNNGGGIYGEASIISSTVTNNTARNNGGGIYGESFVKTEDSFISKNRATKGSGGGIYALDTPLELNNTFINENQAKFRGGGIYSKTEVGMPVIEINEAKIVSNRARRGGGIFNDELSVLNVNNSHVVKNRAQTGGGIVNKGTVNIDDASNVSLNKPNDCVGCQ